jgi:hypothetical protein
MGIRESLENSSKLKQAAVSIMVAGLVVYLARLAMSGSSMPSAKAYFTTDDGATQFVDQMDRFAPFDHDGKPAYRVWMFSTDGGKTRFPGYLERYTPQAKARLTSALEDFKAGKTHMPPDVQASDTEVKAPGVGNPWVNRSNVRAAQEIIKGKIPSDATLEIELPS